MKNPLNKSTYPTFEEYCKCIETDYSFLLKEHFYTNIECHVDNEGYADSGFSAVIKGNSPPIHVAWSEHELILMISYELEDKSLIGIDRSVYFEPFMYFISNYEIEPIIPQYYINMPISKIEKCAEARDKLFQNGYRNVFNNLARRLEDNYVQYAHASPASIAEYHNWYKSHKG